MKPSLVLLLASVPVLAHAADEPKEHVLFMGTDLAVQKGEAFLRVQDVAGSSFMVKVGDNPEYIPMQMRAANLKIDKALKLVTATVQVNKLHGERAYTPAKDPRLQFERESGAATGAAAAADVAAYQQFDIFNQLTAPPAPDSGLYGGGAGGDERSRAMAQHARNESVARAQMVSDMTHAGASAGRMKNALLDELFDAIYIEFELSSPEPLTDVYLVVISRFREADAKPGVFRNWIYARSIGEVGPRPQFMRIREGGFPVGFVLVDYEVHLYQGGRELASNVSPKRVELTREDARQYLLIEHLAANKGGTAPAQPAIGRLPPDLRERMTEGHYLQPYYVRVDEGGNAAGVFLDAACRKAVSDPYLTDLFAAVLFKPALVGGKPTPAVCRVKLPELRL